jgi:hypothetical protein
MNDENIVCRFVFTTGELRSAMRCYWRYSPHKWWLVVLIAIFAWAIAEPLVFPDHLSSAAAPSPSPLLLFLQNVLPMFLFVGLMVFLIFFQSGRSFRKGAYYNQDMTYTLGCNGVRLECPRVQSEMKWEVFPLVVESRTGFILFNLGKRSFNWLPKSGFDSPAKVDQCRELFRNNVKNSRHLFTS